MESYVYRVLNLALRYGDKSKVKTLGPFCHLLDTIVTHAMKKRNKINEKKFYGINLFRGLKLTSQEIEEFEDKINKKDERGY
jgi:hypothetical protein